jgi:hypothetical protein
MHPYLRIRPLPEEAYTQQRKMSTSRQLGAGRVKRAQLSLRSNQGDWPTESGQKLAIHERTARRWMGRFNQLGSAGLAEGPERSARGSTPLKRWESSCKRPCLRRLSSLSPFTPGRLTAWWSISAKSRAFPSSAAACARFFGRRDCAGAIQQVGSANGLLPTSPKKGGYRNPRHGPAR